MIYFDYAEAQLHNQACEKVDQPMGFLTPNPFGTPLSVFKAPSRGDPSEFRDGVWF